MEDKEVEKTEEDENYIVPNVEIKLSKEKRQACREIVREIKSFGVNQRQILYLIQLLVLEIENVDVMKKMITVIGESREEIPLTDQVDVKKKTLIL